MTMFKSEHLGENIMLKETPKKELLKNVYSSSSQETLRPTYKACDKGGTPTLTWKKTILELSQKQGYTDIAL